MLNLAKQSEEINATVNTDMKVPPAQCKHTNAAFPVCFCLYKFTMLPSSCSKWAWSLMYLHQWILPLIQKVRFNFYNKVSVSPSNSEFFFALWWFVALRRLVSIRCDGKKSSLITVIKPGKRLGVYHSQGSVIPVSKSEIISSKRINKAFLILKLVETLQVDDSNKSVIKVQTKVIQQKLKTCREWSLYSVANGGILVFSDIKSEGSSSSRKSLPFLFWIK